MNPSAETPRSLGVPDTGRGLMQRALIVGALVLAATAAGVGLRPERLGRAMAPGVLERGVPRQVEEWIETPSNLVQVDLTVTPDGQRSNERPYDEVITRQYRRPDGSMVMLALAYAAVQQQEIKIHRPDLCYPAQGFMVEQWQTAVLPDLTGQRGPITVVHMLARRNERREAVVYWLRTGAGYGQQMWDGRLEILREGLQGRIPDGILVRASRLVDSPAQAPHAWAELDRFLAATYRASSPDAQQILIQ